MADWLELRFESPNAAIVGSIEERGESLTVARIEAEGDVSGIASGEFARPVHAWVLDPVRDAIPDGTVAFGFQYTEFGMPTLTDASMQGWFLFPARPSLVFPMMLIAPSLETLLLAPLDNFHEQIISVEGGVRWGWHGDLDSVPDGFATELAMLRAASPRAALNEWAAMLHPPARSRYADDLNSRISYWTDNGAAYWYKTEPGHDTTETLVATVGDLRERGVPVSTVQLDSWWYPHATLRPFDTDEWMVPPTGLMEWDARSDVLPDGVGAVRDALDRPPLTTHIRHLSSASPYLEEFDCWTDGAQAHPKSVDLYERWMDSAVAWGVETFEHDWLVECFLGVRGLREAPGRARSWQEGVDRAAGDRGLTLQWCMPTPADLCQTVTLPNVTSIRTSGDHGYLVSAGYLWAWFLYCNAVAGPLGLRPFKDVFMSGGEHAEVECILSVLSTGPVGIGDRLGQAKPTVLRPAHRGDGLLVKPDTPIAAIDKCFTRWATGRDALLTGVATTTHAAGTWSYVLTLNATERAVSGRVSVADCGVDTEAVVWDWRAQRASTDDGWDVALEPGEWDYRVVAPITAGTAVIGDPSLYATAGDMRIGEVSTDGRVTVLGPGDDVELVTWSRSDGTARQTVSVPERGWVIV